MNDQKSGADYSVTNFNVVVVPKDKLLEALEANRTKHNSIYESALAGYWIQAQEVLHKKKVEFDEAIAKVATEFEKQSTQFGASFTHQLTGMQYYVDEKNQAKMAGYFSLGSQISVQVPFNNSLSLVAPESHVEDYDRVIDLLKYTVADKVELSIKDFESYVRNNWAWRQSFLGTNATYTNSLIAISGCVGFLNNATITTGCISMGSTNVCLTGGSVYSMTNQLNRIF